MMGSFFDKKKKCARKTRLGIGEVSSHAFGQQLHNKKDSQTERLEEDTCGCSETHLRPKKGKIPLDRRLYEKCRFCSDALLGEAQGVKIREGFV